MEVVVETVAAVEGLTLLRLYKSTWCLLSRSCKLPHPTKHRNGLFFEKRSSVRQT